MEKFKDFYHRKAKPKSASIHDERRTPWGGIVNADTTGYWIKPNKDIVEVGFYGHSPYLIAMKDSLDFELGELSSNTSDAIAHGWVKVDIARDNMYVDLASKYEWNEIYDIIFRIYNNDIPELTKEFKRSIVSLRVISMMPPGTIYNKFKGQVDESISVKQEGNGIYKVILDDIGYATLQTDADDNYVWLSAVYVKPDYRGQGYFKQLMNEVVSIKEKYFPNKPIKIKVYPFNDEPKNESELINMYRKYGFKDTDKKGYMIYETFKQHFDRDINLWLDDIRPMPKEYNMHVKTAQEAIDILKTNRVKNISFDHDLGMEENGTGYDVAVWIEEMAANAKISRIGWRVHSANPIGARNIEGAMNSAERFWGNN